ncbi:MAG: hypothetical protein ACOC5I_02835, partial [Gemmatimonadota bacterium]
MKPARTALTAIPVAVFMALTALSAPAGAQVVPRPGTSAEEVQRQITSQGLQSSVLERIQESGMSPQQIRQRLASMGYDPSTLD